MVRPHPSALSVAVTAGTRQSAADAKRLSLDFDVARLGTRISEVAALISIEQNPALASRTVCSGSVGRRSQPLRAGPAREGLASAPVFIEELA
jgi:hypothetical protein